MGDHCWESSIDISNPVAESCQTVRHRSHQTKPTQRYLHVKSCFSISIECVDTPENEAVMPIFASVYFNLLLAISTLALDRYIH